jgi:hypothetical protein
MALTWQLDVEPVIAGAAKQSTAPHEERMDCFVAYAPRNDRIESPP